MELLLGNSFVAVVFMSFGKPAPPSLIHMTKSEEQSDDLTGSFYLTYGSTLQPFYGAYTAYGSGGLDEPGFNASYGTSVLQTPLIQLWKICFG